MIQLTLAKYTDQLSSDNKFNKETGKKKRKNRINKKKQQKSNFNESLDQFIVFKNVLITNSTLDKYTNHKSPSRVQMNSKILVILSCTKMKLNAPAPAIRLYQGDIFKVAQKWVKMHNFHELIISAKYGLVPPRKIIKPYDRRLKNLTEARLLRDKVNPKLRKKLLEYEVIVLILGNTYLEVIKPLIEEFTKLSFYRLKSKNGIFDYKKNIRKLLNNDFNVLSRVSGPNILFETLL